MASSTTTTLSTDYTPPSPSLFNSSGNGACAPGGDTASWLLGNYEVVMLTKTIDVDAENFVLPDNSYGTDSCYTNIATHDESTVYYDLKIISSSTVTYERIVKKSYSYLTSTLESRDKYDQDYIDSLLGPGETFKLASESDWSTELHWKEDLNTGGSSGGMHNREYVSSLSFWQDELTVTVQRYRIIDVYSHFFESATGATFIYEPLVSYYVDTKTYVYDLIACLDVDIPFPDKVGQYIYTPSVGGISELNFSGMSDLIIECAANNGIIETSLVDCVTYSRCKAYDTEGIGTIPLFDLPITPPGLSYPPAHLPIEGDCYEYYRYDEVLDLCVYDANIPGGGDLPISGCAPIGGCVIPASVVLEPIELDKILAPGYLESGGLPLQPTGDPVESIVLPIEPTVEPLTGECTIIIECE